MATNVILPALGMSQDTGKIVHWLKTEGEQVTKGEPLVEIETDKATVEVEAPASGRLAHISAREGEDVPVGQVIAVVLAATEETQEQIAPEPTRPLTADAQQESFAQQRSPVKRLSPISSSNGIMAPETGHSSTVVASVLASRIAAEHHVDLGQVRNDGQRVQKADVLAYLQHRQATEGRLQPASPKARRLAREQGKDLSAISGSGPRGAVLTADVLAAQSASASQPTFNPAQPVPMPVTASSEASNLAVSTIWRIMAERTTQSWNEVPHFYLGREVHANRMIAWRDYLMLERDAREITYTDLLVKIVALALRQHPRINATWNAGKITLLEKIHVGLAVAVEAGLVVPVIHHADRLGLREIARTRKELVARARESKLRPADMSEGTFTISNLGMYGVDTFNAIINQPQAAILAVGRISERVVPVNGQPAVRPMMALTLSCDHRTIDGARGAQFLDTLADFIEEPLGLLDQI